MIQVGLAVLRLYLSVPRRGSAGGRGVTKGMTQYADRCARRMGAMLTGTDMTFAPHLSLAALAGDDGQPTLIGHRRHDTTW